MGISKARKSIFCALVVSTNFDQMTVSCTWPYPMQEESTQRKKSKHVHAIYSMESRFFWKTLEPQTGQQHWDSRQHYLEPATPNSCNASLKRFDLTISFPTETEVSTSLNVAALIPSCSSFTIKGWMNGRHQHKWSFLDTNKVNSQEILEADPLLGSPFHSRLWNKTCRDCPTPCYTANWIKRTGSDCQHNN